MNASRLVIALALLVLAGCIPAYVSSTRVDAASLTLVPETPSYIHVSGFADGKACKTQLNLAGSGFLKQKTEIRVAPDEEFTLLAFLTDPVHNCTIAVGFVPKARESYTALIDGTPAKCSMRILRSEGQTLVPEPSMRKRYWAAPAWSNEEPQCHEEAPSARKRTTATRL